MAAIFRATETHTIKKEIKQKVAKDAQKVKENRKKAPSSSLTFYFFAFFAAFCSSGFRLCIAA